VGRVIICVLCKNGVDLKVKVISCTQEEKAAYAVQQAGHTYTQKWKLILCVCVRMLKVMQEIERTLQENGEKLHNVSRMICTCQRAVLRRYYVAHSGWEI